jgi:hypothetical protein
MQITLRNGTGGLIRGMGFGIGERLAEMEPGFTADVLFRPCLDEWNGSTYLKWHVRDFVAT